MKKRLSLVAVLLAFLLVFASCGSNTPNKGDNNSSGANAAGLTVVNAADMSKNPAAAAGRKDTMVIGVADMTAIWSEPFGSNSYDWYVCETMFDDLIRSTPDGKVEENAATYKVSDDGLVYTFTIKDNVNYWDGNPATAKDIEWMFYVLADPNFAGSADITTAGIKGLKDYKEGSATTISGINVVNDKTIEVTLDAPNAPGIWNLGLIPLMEKSHYAPDFKKGDAKALEEKLSTPMGTGQYKFVSYTPGTVKLVANEKYFKGVPNIKNLEFSVTPEGKELQRVQAGETDMDNATCNEDNIASMKNSGFISAYYFPTNGYGMIQWNLTDPRFSDVRVRQALAYALNREAVVKQVYGPYGKVNSVPLPQGSWGWTNKDINDYKFDIKKAKDLLKEAGWTLDSNNKLVKDGKPFVIDFIATEGNSVTDVMLPVMKKDYLELGITVNIEAADWNTLYQGYVDGKNDASFMGQGLSSPDPDPSTNFLTGSTQNYYKYSNPEVDKLINEELKESDPAKRIEIFHKLDKILNTELPLFPIYQRNDMFVINGRIGNVPAFGAFRDPYLDVYKYTIK